ncbi:S9 family peptidase [Bifidobacterium catulorum]|uniref:Peptidase n=1 Tax=Bifidobacterium catulorum TaxID=1630173 RepID=A0A2U2MTV1_9BIFI|nr:prolyl oligopeptidase family serine peptidase [Bifidobacterium catulorum]PWG60298.1 peptidase [Bifidobacterium catulorum]
MTQPNQFNIDITTDAANETAGSADIAAAIAAYPRAKARTLRFSLGAPRTATVVDDGARALFLRSRGPQDDVTCLWMSWFDGAGTHHETLLADPRELLAAVGTNATAADVPDEEKARRERARESADGIVAYSVNESGNRVAFTVGGRLWLTTIVFDGDIEFISDIQEFISDIQSDGDIQSGGDADTTASGPCRVTIDDGELHAVTRELGDTWYVSAMAVHGHPGRLFRPVLNPRISPNGRLVAYTTGRMINLVVIGENGDPDDERSICGVYDDPNVTVGLAEFAAGEEMDRYDGFWWSPDSKSLLIERADESPEPVWHISDPANPTAPATRRHYPQALTRNADVRLFRFDIGSAEHRAGNMAYSSIVDLPEVWWDRHGYEYLADVHWSRGGDPLLLVQNRRQTADQVLMVGKEGSNPSVGYASQQGILDGFALEQDGGALAAEERHRWLPTTTLTVSGSRYWLDLIHGCPSWTPDGRLVTAMPDEETDTMRLAVDGHAFTPAGWQVLSVLDVTDHDVLARATRDSRGVDVVSFPLPSAGQEFVGSYWQEVRDDSRGIETPKASNTDGFGNRFAADSNGDGDYDASGESATPVVLNPEPGVWTASRAGDGVVLSGRTMHDAKSVMIHTVGDAASATIVNHAETPGFTPNVLFTQLGKRGLQTAITLPSAGSPYAHAESLPVLMKPYGGPMHREVMLAQSMYWDAQWWADQGFIVVAADGRGTGARGLAWDHAMFERFADVALEDQTDAVRALPEALAAIAADAPRPDLDRVAMIGWSFGGFLSALAVLRAPDVFAAACAGAPPTDWTLYDTHYTERYLGLNPRVYEKNSLIKDAPNLRRPLLLIHGFADDNVTVANTLRLSSALLAAGREHTVLPLTGITHMTNDETVAENLLLFQRDFLRKALAR